MHHPVPGSKLEAATAGWGPSHRPHGPRGHRPEYGGLDAPAWDVRGSSGQQCAGAFGESRRASGPTAGPFAACPGTAGGFRIQGLKGVHPAAMSASSVGAKLAIVSLANSRVDMFSCLICHARK